MSDSVRPHRWQPTRLPCPWNSPGKNTGVGCHFLLQCMKVKSERKVTQSCPILRDPMNCSPPASSIHGIFQARLLEWGVITNNRLTVLLRRDQKSSRFSPFYEVAVRRQPLASQEGRSSGTKSVYQRDICTPCSFHLFKIAKI